MSTLKVNAITNVAGNTDISGVGKYKSYALVVDRKSQNSSSGTFSSGAFRTRDLNTILIDPDSIVSVSSNQFTLQAGTYLIMGSCPALECDTHIARLNNVTTSDDTIGLGTNAFVGANDNGQSRSFFTSRVTISSATVFSVLHRCTTTNSNNGFGITAGLDFEIFTRVEIYKET